MRLRLIPVLLIVGIAAAGCGSSSNKNAAAPAATTTATAAATTSAATTAAPSAPSSGGLTGDCKKLADLSTKFSQAMANASNTQGNPSQQVGEAAKLIHAFADAAPGSVRPDLETLAKAFDQYASAVKGVNLQTGKVPSAADVAKITKAAQAFTSPQVRQAEAHLATWAKQNCGGVLPTTTG